MLEEDRFRLTGRRAELDGVRGLAILLVLLCHTRVPGLYAAGATGVTLFFVLSGFLISSLLLEEYRSSCTLSLGRFYARRARRLAPALAVWASCVTLLGIALGEPPWLFQWRYLGESLSYAGNWVLAAGGWLGAFNGTWSLAVEEQFYLLLPLLMRFVLRHGERAFALIAGAVVAISLIIRVYLIVEEAPVMEVYYRTDTSAVGLASGALLAVTLRSCHAPRRWLPRPWVPAIGLLALALACTGLGDAAFGIVPVFGSLGGVLLIAGALRRAESWLRVPPLVWLGERSYGVYLWHMVPAWLLADAVHASWPVVMGGTVALALPLAEASWRFVERPVLRRRSVPSPRVSSVPSTV